MTALTGKSAVITGASQGIGEAMAAALYAAGVRLALLGRSRKRLESSIAGLPATAAPPPLLVEADLLNSMSLTEAAEQISDSLQTVDILINCGGAYLRGPWDAPEPDTFRDLVSSNIVGPYTLTRLLLPQLIAARGDVVFVNSSITRSPGTGASQYKATQHALQAVSDTLRAEFNEKGIRVLTIYPGRTATPRQEYIHADESRVYDQDILLQASDVADTVLFCLSLPGTAEVTDLYIRPRIKS